MSVKAILRPNVAKIVVLSLSVLLGGCGSSGGGGGDGEPSATSVTSTASTASTETSDVPLELITMEDPSAVLDAVGRGIDPERQLLRTPFHCYYNIDVNGVPETGFSTPHVSVDFVGDSFSTTGILGNLTGSINDDENSDRLNLTFDGAGSFSYRIEFDLFGQRLFEEPNMPDLAGCYQSGASHERALHQFLLNTPEEGDFSCQASVNGSAPSNAGPLQLLSGNRYSYNQSEGTYQISELFESNFSVFRFDTGGLAGFQGGYTENPDTGTQQLSFSEETSGQALNCSRQRQPRPFKQFGADLVPLPPASSVPISGDFYNESGNGGGVGWAKFSADGFVDLDNAIPGPSNCQRTLPNGLPPCISYTYNGGSTISVSLLDEQFTAFFSIGSDGSLLIEDLGRFVPVNTPTANELVGLWQISTGTIFDPVDASLCIIGFCSPTSSSSGMLEFFSDGRFTFNSNSQSTTSTNVPGVNTVTTAQSQSASAGVYRLEGTGIELLDDSGQIGESPVFIHLLDSNTLAIADVVFRRIL